MVLLCALSLSSCSIVKATGAVVGTTGKVVYTTAKVAGKVVGTTAKVAGKTVVTAGKGVRTVVNMATGKHVVKLDKRGNSLVADVLLNRKVRADLILDTGATDTVISNNLAKKLGISASKGSIVLCQMADGRSVSGRQITIKEIRVGGAKVYNARAVVLGSGEIGDSPGLLGMSFLNNFIFKVDSEQGLLTLQKR